MIATRPGRSKLSAGVASHMNALVTGATGFVGANVARMLVADGYRVRVLVRPASSLKALEGCPVEMVRGDILEPGSVAAAITGCARVFHVAGDYRLWARAPAEIYRNNVEGTRTVLEACARAGVERVVYTSSVGTLGLPQDGAPGTETTPVTLDDMIPGDRAETKKRVRAFLDAKHVSYPNAADRFRARRLHVSPGGEIMIHGTPNGWRGLRLVFAHTDWTAGCIAVSDAEIEEIWKLVPNGTLVEIRP